MYPENISLLTKSITRRYLLAVGIIALLSTGAFYSLQSALEDSENTAYIVNLSGRQRMLSQHIALDVNRIYKQLHTQNPALVELKRLLTRNISDMETANRELSSGILANNQVIDLSEPIRNMYFGEMNLYYRVNAYLELARNILKSDSKAEASIHIEKIDQISESLLKDLNTVVNQYQKEGEQRLEVIEKMEWLVWSATLIALLLEVLFIFRPMVGEVIASKKAETSVMKNLQELVELRTLKLEMANKKLKNLAGLDPLTNLRNRLTLEVDIESLIVNYLNNHSDFALCMIDIDWFKKVNDNFGHLAGDYILQELAMLLSQITRDSDQVYRSGGEEFVLILNRINKQEAITKAEQLRKLIEQHHFEYESHPIPMTISIGLYHTSLFPVADVHQVLQAADKALYISKNQGRNQLIIAERTTAKKNNHPKGIRIRISFADTKLTEIIKLDPEFEIQLGYDTHALLQGQIHFVDCLYSADKDLYQKIIQDAQLRRDSFYTIRLIKTDGSINIYRLELTCDNKQFIITIQNAKDAATSIGDNLLIHNFHAMMENTNDYIYFKDRNHVFTAASKTLVELTSVENRHELIGKTDYDVFPKNYADEYYTLEKKVFSGEVPVAQKFQPTLTKAGKKGWIDNRKYPILDSKGNIIGLFGIARKLSAQDYEQMQGKF
jgi:diguanylate cyclase (GGDEF)-like protein/PAS domain S-box-containing protein